MGNVYTAIISKLLPDFDEREEHDDKKYRSSASAIRAPSLPNYLERRFTEMHHNAVGYKFCDKFISIALAALLIVLLPYLHIGVFYLKIWVPDKPPIDKFGCTCSCFDTVFRGRYEMPGLVTYKHVYFNATKNSLKIWTMTTLFILMFYESVKYLINVFRTSRCRPVWLLLYFINIYPHYYSWWSFFSYYNEEFYTFFTHHMFFCITELLVTAVVLNLINAKSELKVWKMMTIIAINLVHIIVSGSDQFISHVLRGYGTNFQNARNIGLMIPDVLHILIPSYQFYKIIRARDVSMGELCYKEELILFILFIALGTLIGRIL